MFQSIQMLCPLLLVGLLLRDAVRPWMVVSLSLMIGVTDALSMPSFQSIVPRDKIASALALNATQFNLSRILGPALAGILMAERNRPTSLLRNSSSMPDANADWTTRCASSQVVFLDTKLTDLIGEPLLLSIGAVAGGSGDREFHVEVNDEARIASASAFASNVVLPQFGKIPGAACTYFELGARAARFPDGLASPLETGQVIAVAYESDCDWVPLERALRETREKRLLDLKPRSHPVNVHNVPGFAAGERAAKTYFDAQRLALSSRHHALCDARTLRIAYEAAAASTARQAESSHLFAGKWQQRPVSSRLHVKTSA